jgi:hypothetical protein
MATLADEIGTMVPGKEYRVLREGVRATELGSFDFPVRIRLRAFTAHDGGGDSSTAWMKLFYDGVLVGEDSDRHFNAADLKVRYEVDIDRGNTADFRIESGNQGATERRYGFEFWLSPAPV